MRSAQPSRGASTSGVGNTRARYRRILRFAGWNLTVTWWYELVLPRIGLSRVAERSRSKRMRRFAQRFHVLAVDLGGLMIKVGQFMSSRLDVLPPEITAELEGLQDEVPPVPFAAIRALAEAELGMPLERAFAAVDEIPVAAASLGQAHRARLAPLDVDDTGLDAVVIKVQRPGIEAIVETDLAALRKVGGWLSRVRLVSDRVDARALVEEFAQTSLQEIEYLHEAANAERFAVDFADDDRVGVPAIVWERTTRRVLTLEDVTAIKVTDAGALRAAGIDPTQVAPVFATVMFDQLFTNGFFHADPHPGNIFVTPVAGPGEPRAPAWKLTFIDFGMMGEVPSGTRRGLRKLLIAAASRDGKGLVDAMRDLGVLLPSAETADLERAMTQLFARFGGMGFAELREVDPPGVPRLRRGVRRRGAVAAVPVAGELPADHPGDVADLGGLQRARSGVQPLGLDRALRRAADPRGERKCGAGSRAAGPRGRRHRLSPPEARGCARHALRRRIGRGRDPILEKRVARLERAARRVVSAILFAALLVAGAVVRVDDGVLGTVLMVASILPLLHAFFAGRRAR